MAAAVCMVNPMAGQRRGPLGRMVAVVPSVLAVVAAIASAVDPGPSTVAAVVASVQAGMLMVAGLAAEEVAVVEAAAAGVVLC